MLFRIFAALFFTVAGTLAGSFQSGKLKTQCEICIETEKLLNQAGIMIRYQAVDVYELVSRLKESCGADTLTFLEFLPAEYVQGENFHEQWRKAVGMQENLSGDIRKLLCEFGDFLGTSDIEGQLSSIEALSRSAESLTEKYRGIYVQKGRLYRSVGVLFGVTAGILVI